jgi:hypothetical protein
VNVLAIMGCGALELSIALSFVIFSFAVVALRRAMRDQDADDQG